MALDDGTNGTAHQPLPEIEGHRGHTVMPVKWNAVKEQNGTRYIEGVAYNAAIKGERQRVTCPDEVWNHPDDDVFYWDESIRWTVDELASMDLYGVPMRVQHDTSDDLPSVGSIIHSFVDSEGNLRIVAEVPAGPGNEYGNAMATLIDNGTCSDLSISYPLERDPHTQVVRHGPVDEVSFVTEGHFRGSRVTVRASNKRSQGDMPNSRRSDPSKPYTWFRVVRAKYSGPAGSPTSSVKEEKGKKVSKISSAAPAQKSRLSLIQVRHLLELVAAERTLDHFHFSHASQNTQQQSERMSNAPADNNASNTAPANNAAGTSQEDLVRNLAQIKKRMMEAEEKAKQAEERAKEAETRAKQFEDEKQREWDRYAEENGPRAEEVTAHLRDIAKAQGVDVLSEDWAKFNKGILTSPDPLAKEMQAVQVSCSRGFRALQAENDRLKARNEELEKMADLAGKMSSIDNRASAEEQERLGRRDVKAAAQKAKRARQEQPQPREVPDWVQRFLPRGASLEGYAQRRSVQAKRSEPMDTSDHNDDVDEEEEEEAEQMQTRSVHANYVGRPRNNKSMARQGANREFWNFMKDKLPSTDFTTGALAGMEIPEREGQY